MNGRIISAAIVFFFSFSLNAFGGELAVIVHPDNPLDNLSRSDLKKIFLYEREYWEDGSRVLLLMRESGSAEKKKFMEKVYEISEEELKRLWLSKLYKGEIPSLPRVIRSNKSMRIFVANVPNSIGFIDSAFVDDTVRILKIEGKLPAHPSYLFKESK